MQTSIPAGEARTADYVAKNGGEDASFDQFVEPGALILSGILERLLPISKPVKKLLEKCEKLKGVLPRNPLVGPRCRVQGCDWGESGQVFAVCSACCALAGEPDVALLTS